MKIEYNIAHIRYVLYMINLNQSSTIGCVTNAGHKHIVTFIRIVLFQFIAAHGFLFQKLNGINYFSAEFIFIVRENVLAYSSEQSNTFYMGHTSKLSGRQYDLIFMYTHIVSNIFYILYPTLNFRKVKKKRCWVY